MCFRFQGTDPASQLIRFVRDIRGSTFQMDMVSLGRGQETRTEDTVYKAYRHRGRWVFLQNCHLALSFMPQLKEMIRKYVPCISSSFSSIYCTVIFPSCIKYLR